MPASRLELLRWQFDLTWSLFEYHLERLAPEDCSWVPARVHWTVHPAADGTWVPDWSEEELDPIPVPTAAWVVWHITWWWTVTLDHMRHRTPRERADVLWPGDAAKAVESLRRLRTEWTDVLDGLADGDLDEVATFPWHGDPAFTIGHTVAWVNTELAKNASEIGQLRLIRAAA